VDAVTMIYTNSSGKKKGLTRKNPQSVGYGSDPGEPNYWYEWGNKVGIFPMLSTAAGETVTLYYVSAPPSVAVSDAVVVPKVYDRALTLYVAAQALLKEGSYAKSGRLMAEYYAELDRFRTDFVERPQEPEANIKPVP